MAHNILNKRGLQDEIQNYKNTIESNKKYGIMYLTLTISLLILSAISLILIYTEYGASVNIFGGRQGPNAYLFIFTTLIVFLILAIFVPFSIVWYFKKHNEIQAHMPLTLQTKVIDICAIIIGVFDFITAILAALAPIVFGQRHEEWAWFADTKVIIYIIMCSFIFLFWTVLIPVFQSKMIEKDNEYFNKYVMFEYEKIPEYIKLLEAKFKIRAKEFNKKIASMKLSEKDKKNIIYRPIKKGEVFSWDVRRIYKGKESEYGNEYDLIKYILFVEIYASIVQAEVKEHELKNHIDSFMRVKNEKKIMEFNKKFMKFMKKLS